MSFHKKRASRRALYARKWFALDGPRDAPPLPLSYVEREDLKSEGSGFLRMVAYYARSLEAQEYNLEVHPSFDDYACGVMACDHTPEFMTDDEELRRRFPPRPLTGLDTCLYWETPEEYAKTMALERRRKAREARLVPQV
jgi:hypothetical protein